MSNSFFKNYGPFSIKKILNIINADILDHDSSIEVSDIKDLDTSSVKDITFFHSKKYESFASITKASYCLTNKNLSHKDAFKQAAKNLREDNGQLQIVTYFNPNSVQQEA